MKKRYFIRVIAALLIIGAVGAALYATIGRSNKVDTTRVFSDSTMLSGLWNNYKQTYWDKESGRTVDRQQNDITTSEGQSYTMLRAVWQSDKPTFDKTWKWTKDTIQRKDNLFSWKWGKKSDGTYGTLTDVGGQNTASDADSDIALALIMAASRWQERSYLDEAQKIVPSIWETEVVSVGGKPYLAANDLEKKSQKDIVINPSYFAPYAFKVFARLDKKNDWKGLTDSSYSLLNSSMDAKLNTAKKGVLPPDWILMNRQTATIKAPDGAASNLTTNYGYDAMRTPWRLALDYQWNNDPRAKTTLQKMSFLSDQWQQKGKLAAIYAHDGAIVSTDEPPETYGTALGYFMVARPDQAKEIYQTKLLSLYDATNNKWAQPLNYYSDNWAWFGIALYNHQLENLPNDSMRIM